MPVYGHAVLLTIGQRVPTPQSIELGGIAQRLERARVHVGRGPCDIAQRWHLEPAAQARVARHGFGARVERDAFGVADANDGDLLVREQRRRMALRAARDEGTKHVHAGDLVVAERFVVAMGVLVIAAVERDQRGLEGRDCRIDHLERRRALAVGIRLAKQAAVGVVATDVGEQLRRVIAHLLRVVQRPHHLLFERTGATVPEKGLQERHVPEAGRGAADDRAVDADAAWPPVRKAEVGMMAAGAGERTVGRQQGIEEQVSAEIDLLRREAVARGGQAGLRAADAGITQRLVILIQRAQFAAIAVRQFEARRAEVAQSDLRIGEDRRAGEQGD